MAATAAIPSRRIELPPWSAPLLEPHRYKSLRGGRGGAKSWTVAQLLLLLGVDRPLRVLCARQLQNSIKDSVHRLLCDQIARHRLPYEITRDEIRGTRAPSLFLFEGIKHNVTKIKSMEGVDVCWVEEAQSVSEDSWQILIPTIRKAGSEIWLTWNPDQDSDPTYRRFVTNPPPDCLGIEVNWDQNPWISPALLAEKDYDYRVDPEAAAHVWGGKTRRLTNAQVLRGRYAVEPFEPQPGWDGPYYGADWGFAADPTALVRCWVHVPVTKPGEVKRGPVLYVEYEAYGVGIDTVNLPELFDRIPGAREHAIRADSARPETISHMQHSGYPRMVGATKGPGSVEDGVEHLRSYERILIHPRCTHAAEEARLWSFKVDRLTGDVLPQLVDKHDHCWDAIRYALEPLIKKRPAFWVL